MITQLLEREFAEASKLPVPQQDTIATLIMEEMGAEKQWDDAFANSQDMLAQMAEQALSEHKKGEMRPLDVDFRSQNIPIRS